MPHFTDLVKVFLCGSHFFPGLVEKLNANAEKLLQQPILVEEDGVVVRSRFRGCGQGQKGSTGGGGSHQGFQAVKRAADQYMAPLTGLSDTKDFTEDECELDAAPGKRTFVFVFSAAVFQHKLGKELNKESW